jgi:hypothetical protein
MIVRLASYAAVLLCLAAGAVSAGQPEPPKPQPQPPAVSVQQITDWTPYLNDFQGADAAKQEAAAKTFVEAGSRGYAALATLLKNPNAEIAKRAAKVRQEIDVRSWKTYQELAAKRNQLHGQALTSQSIEDLRQAFVKLAMYASPEPLRRLCFQTATELQNKLREFEQASRQLSTLDQLLKAAPEPKGLRRAAIQVERADALHTQQCYKDVLGAAQDAEAHSGKEGRFAPRALKLQAEASLKLGEAKEHEALCRRILAEYPRSLEVRYAHRALVQLLPVLGRWDDAVQQAKAYLTAFPLDEEAQNEVYGLFSTLLEDERDYARMAGMAEWLLATLPPDRIRPELPKYCGGYNEYAAKDYAKAERAYALLRDNFTDLVSPDEMNSAIARLKLKAEGKFPKEPQPGDAGPAGLFAKMLAAIRARDGKAAAALSAKDGAEELAERIADSTDDLVAIASFADFIVKNVEINKAQTGAKIVVECYDASTTKPLAYNVAAGVEDGQWKIMWEDPPTEEEELEEPAPGPAPAPKTGKNTEALKE